MGRTERKKPTQTFKNIPTQENIHNKQECRSDEQKQREEKESTNFDFWY